MAMRGVVSLVSALSIVCSAFVVPGASGYFKQNLFSNSVQRQDMQEYCPKVMPATCLIIIFYVRLSNR